MDRGTEGSPGPALLQVGGPEALGPHHRPEGHQGPRGISPTTSDAVLCPPGPPKTERGVRVRIKRRRETPTEGLFRSFDTTARVRARGGLFLVENLRTMRSQT